MNIDPIQNGIVIDHITAGLGMRIYELLELDKLDTCVAIIKNAKSEKYGKKDIIKIEDRELDSKTVDKIALIAPDATIAIIRDFYVAEKYQVRLDDHVVGLARCSNPNCITNRGEPVKPEFTVVSRHPPQLRCCYCDRMLTNISDNLL